MSEEITLYRINKGVPIFVRQGIREREWMDKTVNQYAYRCLPLTIANQHGYEVSTDKPIKIIWNGGNNTHDIYIETHDKIKNTVSSHFGYGIVTFQLNLLVRTPENVNTYVSGVPNYTKRGIVPLQGIVETDWNPATFTMNWQMTEPGFEVVFEPYEPFCFFYPIERKYIDNFHIKIKALEDNKEEFDNYHQWSNDRTLFNRGHLGDQVQWQKHYFQGKYNNGEKTNMNHETKIKLEEPKLEILDEKD